MLVVSVRFWGALRFRRADKSIVFVFDWGKGCPDDILGDIGVNFVFYTQQAAAAKAVGIGLPDVVLFGFCKS